MVATQIVMSGNGLRIFLVSVRLTADYTVCSIFALILLHGNHTYMALYYAHVVNYFFGLAGYAVFLANIS